MSSSSEPFSLWFLMPAEFDPFPGLQKTCQTSILTWGSVLQLRVVAPSLTVNCLCLAQTGIQRLGGSVELRQHEGEREEREMKACAHHSPACSRQSLDCRAVLPNQLCWKLLSHWIPCGQPYELVVILCRGQPFRYRKIPFSTVG